MRPTEIISAVFNLGLAIYFIFALAYPKQTGFWLVFDGLAILMLAFFGPVIILLAMQIVRYFQTGSVSIDATTPFPKKGVRSRIILTAAVILWLLFFSYGFSVHNPANFLFFIFYTGLYAYSSRFEPGLSGRGSLKRNFVLFVFSTLVALMLIFPLAFFRVDPRPAPFIELARSGNYHGYPIDGITFLATWGFAYFLLMALTSLPPVGESADKWISRNLHPKSPAGPPSMR